MLLILAILEQNGVQNVDMLVFGVLRRALKFVLGLDI